MDVVNVARQYADFIDHQKKILQEAKKRQGQRPCDRKSREYTYLKFMAAARFKRIGKQMEIHSSLTPPAYLPCTLPMAKLTNVAIKDLQLETHHRGTYLLLRSITPPNRMTAIMAIMEDENGDVMMLQLYQQEDEGKRPVVDVVNVGTILLVKEPYFKVQGDGEYGLRVDHLSDVVQIKNNDARIPKAWQQRKIPSAYSAESLKTKGNLSMEKKRYWDAITEYSDALGYPATADLIDIIKRNRALAFLKTNQFDAALTDSGFPNLNPNSSEKALYRAADALYHLEKFSECCQVLELLCSSFPHNSQASVALDRAQIRSQEQKTGLYDFKQLQAKAKKLRPPHLDHASYLGPVEIRQTESRGRGLFVTKAVMAGDLLLCEKAFSHAHAAEGADDGNENSSKISLLINPETNKGFMGAQADLIKLIVQKLYRNPSIAPAFVTLYHGAYEGVSTSTVDDKPVVDTFLVERIISTNVFGCPISSLNSHIESCDRSSPTGNKIGEQKGHHSCGIWTHASYINHSCTSTARRAFIGNMMIIRASRDMEAGSEITFCYSSPNAIMSAKDVDKAHKHWDFVCGCAICVDVRATSAVIHTKREKLIEEVKRAFNFNSPTARHFELEKIKHLLEKLSKTYAQPAEDVPRLSLWDLQLTMTRIYASQNKADKTMEFAVKVLTSLGFVVVGADSSQTLFTIVRWGLLVDNLVETFLHARTAFTAMKAMEDSARAEEYAKTTFKILVGEDESFDATYGE